jgi:DNA repair exonuclease SbcCD ATPase subunit
MTEAWAWVKEVSVKLRRAVLDNWCQYDHMEVEFADGMTAVMGPNGAGKTNLLNSVVWCITGDDRNAGVKQDNINLHAEPADRAGVLVEFEHESNEIEIYRDLRHSRQWLRINGGEDIRRDREIKDALQDILGVSSKMLLDYVFVGQRKIFDFLEEDTDVVAKAMSQLFGVEKAEQIYKVLGEVKLPSHGTFIDGDVVAARLEQEKVELAALERQLTSFAALPDPWIESQTSEAATIATYERREYCLQKLDECVETLSVLKKEGQRLDAERKEKQALLRAAKAEHDECWAAIGPAHVELADWQVFDVAESNRKTASKRKAQQEAELAALTLPLQPTGYIELNSEQHKELADLVAETTKLQTFLGTWEKTGLAECQSCGTPTDKIAERIPEARARLEEVIALVATGRKQWDASENYRRQSAAYSQKRARLVTLLESLSGQADATMPKQPTRDKETLRGIITKQKACETRFNELASLCMNIEKRHAEHQANFSKTQGARQTLDEQLSELTVSEGQYTAAKTRLEAARKAAEQRHYASARKAVLTRQIADDEDALAKYHACRERFQKVQALSEHFVKVRQAFHRDAIVRETVEGYLAEMHDGINELLTAFDANFRVEGFAKWQYMVKKDGKVHSARRLSDGEKVLFALAFRVMVNSVFVKELGLLCLDEPTSGLDEDNMACLDVALGRLRELSQARGLQVLLITHDRDVNLFDRVYRLAGTK